MNPIGSNGPVIIGIDSGYGNTKTAHFCFPTAVTAHDREPVFRMNLLVYNGRYYTIGEGHKEFVAEKAVDQDHYVLMLAGAAQELRHHNLTNARVHLAAGLPLTWVSVQKDSYRACLMVDMIAARKENYWQVQPERGRNGRKDSGTVRLRDEPAGYLGANQKPVRCGNLT